MSKTRLLQAPKPKTQRPRTPVEWTALMKKAIARAEAVGDRRVENMKKALRRGGVEQKLRRMSIISEADIAREFPQIP